MTGRRSPTRLSSSFPPDLLLPLPPHSCFSPPISTRLLTLSFLPGVGGPIRFRPSRPPKAVSGIRGNGKMFANGAIKT